MMGAPNFELFRFMAETFGIETFIETGSGHGTTAYEATNIFPLVHTIELSNSLHQEVSSKLDGKAKCYHGKSSNVLRSILPEIFGPVLYWLDAHWSMGSTAGKSEQCLLLSELREINRREMNYDFIFIDDAHVFLSPSVLKPPYEVAQWPSIMEIFSALNEKERYTVILSSWRCVQHGVPGGIVFPEDVIVSVPSYAKDQFYRRLLSLVLEN